ncbi:HEPN domain-containing protein [Hydrocarboniphaga effusa]|jgi:hypothetical protein|uniref:ApeA N-terminal domain 1-containing protein n=2 Tax=Hydrocarboniphaga effusa TaxID=243629 RepID=UPI003BA9D378
MNLLRANQHKRFQYVSRVLFSELPGLLTFDDLPMKSKKNSSKRKHYLGRFDLPNGLTEIGEMRLDAPRITLDLHSDNKLDAIKDATYIRGTTFSGECLSLIDCYSTGAGHSFDEHKITRHHAWASAHYAVVGKAHIAPGEASVRCIEFTATDIALLFNDNEAFSHVINSSAAMPALVEEHETTARKYGFEPRPLQVGEYPHIFYFTGRDRICEIHTAIGLISVQHRIRFRLPSPSKGIRVKNRMVVVITPNQPITFIEALGAMHDMASFLSAAVGRAQGVSHIKIDVGEADAETRLLLDVHPSFPIKGVKDDGGRTLKPNDLPLNPIFRLDEFRTVLINWMEKQDGRRTARYRHLDCLRKANSYGPDRIVAAANMFDVLPSEATPVAAELSAELAETRDQCIALLRKHASGPDRNGALSALGRLGKPSLPKKVSYRASIVVEKMGRKFPNLQDVASLAVKCRNYFVHGGDDFDIDRLQDFIPFLTDTLEFIFVASDFLESGWNPDHWLEDSYGVENQFAKFLWIYESTLAELVQAQAKPT